MSDLAVGQVLARQGAWNRKFQVIAISMTIGRKVGPTEFMQSYKVVELKFLGNFYATGLQNIPKVPGKTNEIYCPVYYKTGGVEEFPITNVGGYGHDDNFDLKRLELGNIG